MYAYCQNLPGVTEEMTARIEAEVGDAPIEGLIAHVAGPMRGGWRIIDVYESFEDYQRFMRERLGPAMQQVLAGMPAPSQPADLFEVHGLERFAWAGGVRVDV
ncbi:MAG TPA: hypothetical protein VLR26_03840 [Frankiaceae bacterium]|nr:hypothetical protein [Frankiaceae bacterium]